jgi:hypothetical protein
MSATARATLHRVYAANFLNGRSLSGVGLVVIMMCSSKTQH